MTRHKTAALLVLLLAGALSCKPKTREACLAKCEATARDDYKRCDKHPSQRNCSAMASVLARSCNSGCERDFPTTK